jgi:hypothetical protein
MFRPRAEARARRRFHGAIRRAFPDLFTASAEEATEHADA